MREPSQFRAARAAAAAADPSLTGGKTVDKKKTRDFVVVDPKGLTRHGRQLKKGVTFWIKKSSSSSHVDRWVKEGRIREVLKK